MPFSDEVLRFSEMLEVVLVEALFPQPATKALDVAVLHLLAGVDEVQVDVAIGGPACWLEAYELRTVVELWTNPETLALAPQPEHATHTVAT